MSVEEIKNKKQHRLKVGVKQSQKAVFSGQAQKVFVAKDAEQHVIRHVLEMACAQGIPVEWVDSMWALGQACEIEVGAAIAVITQ